MTANRALKYAFQTNALNYLFVVDPNVDANSNDKKEASEWDKEASSWIGNGPYEIYYGPADALNKLEGKVRRGCIHMMMNKEGAQIQFPSDGGEYDREPNQTFCLATDGSGRGGYRLKQTLTRVSPTTLPRDLFELLDVPPPSAVKFQLKQ